MSNNIESNKLIEVYKCLSAMPVVGADNIKRMAGVFAILEDVINALQGKEKANSKEEG